MSTKVNSGKMEEHTNMPNVNETGEQPKRRGGTAESMAAKQRDITEAFSHLLGGVAGGLHDSSMLWRRESLLVT